MEPDEADKPSGAELLKQFMSRSLSDSMSNAAVLSFVDGIGKMQHSRRRHERQVDTLWKKKCPDEFDPVDEDEDGMKNVIMNNVFTNEEALQNLLTQDNKKSQAVSEAATPTPASTPAPKRGLSNMAKAAIVGAGAAGLLGTGVGVVSYMRPQPRGADISGIEFEITEEVEESIELSAQPTPPSP